MADTKTSAVEREYVIPLRKFWLRVPRYERTGKAIKEIKKFIAKHMKVADRDVSKVKLDVYFNNELWFKGRQSPPAKIKVKATRDGDIVKVTFAEVPKYVEFIKAKAERRQKVAEKKPEVKEEKKAEEKTDEQKTEEKEKEKSVAEAKVKDIKQSVKAEKHTTKSKEATRPVRMSLQK